MSEFKYDVFVSHSSADKTAVRELAERLKADGLRVWLDEWEIQAGDLVPLKIEQGLEQSRILLLVMSANAFSSEWVTLERHTVLFRDPTNAQRRFIPLRLDDSEIKDALKQFAYIDWRQPTPEEYARLLAVCKPIPRKPRAISTRRMVQEKRFIVDPAGVWCSALSKDGRLAIFGYDDRTVRVWDIDKQCELAAFPGHTSDIRSVALSLDGRRALSGSDDKTIRVWDIESGRCLVTLKGHNKSINGLALSSDGQKVLSGSDDRSVRLWDVESGRCLSVLGGHTGGVWSVAFIDEQRAVSCAADHSLRVWDLESERCKRVLEGHTDQVYTVVPSNDGRRALSASDDKTVRVWNIDNGRCQAILEGHTDDIWGVAWSSDGRRAVSGSDDDTVRVWDVDSGRPLSTLEGHTGGVWSVGWRNRDQSIVAATGDGEVWVWSSRTLDQYSGSAEKYFRYTNAKVLLVGDSGVGKTGLAIRLTEDHFELTISTDAALVKRLKPTRELSSGETERDIWLWDFAGQSDYRLVHRLFLDEIALAIVMFNPQSDDPFAVIGEWDRALEKAARRPFKKLLVAGRTDRGGLVVSRKSIDTFVAERGFSEYLEVSAYTGAGCQELREAIVRNIRWTEIPWIASPRIFRLLKEAILQLKEEGKVLLRMVELKQQLEMRLPDESFTQDQLRAVVGLLASPTVVWHLEFGDFILLEPEQINSYGSAVIRKVRSHTEEIGCIPEQDVIEGRLDYQDMKRLPPAEEQIVLRAMHKIFVDHGLCLREATEAGPLLVFPSYFKRERPELDGHPAIFVTYRFNGQLDEIYSTLVVRLHHTAAFDKDQLWKFAADFKTQEGKRLGLKLTNRGEGSGAIDIYFDPGIPDDTKITFIRYVHEHLKLKARALERFRNYACPNCHAPVTDRTAAQTRLSRGLTDIACQLCEERVPLWDLIEQKFASDELRQRVDEMQDEVRASVNNETNELVLLNHAFAVAAEAGQVFRLATDSKWGIDGEIEFRNKDGALSGRRVYLQFKSDSYLDGKKRDGQEILALKDPSQLEYWRQLDGALMLVIRTSEHIRWMNVTEYLSHGGDITQIEFKGEEFTAMSLLRLGDTLLFADGSGPSVNH